MILFHKKTKNIQLIFIFIIVLLFLLSPLYQKQKITAQIPNQDSCISISIPEEIQRNGVNGDNPQDIPVTVKIRYFPGFDPRNFRLAVNLSGTLSWFNINSPQSISPNPIPIDNPPQEVTMTFTINRNLYQKINLNTYLIYFETNNGIRLKQQNGADCMTSFQIYLPNNHRTGSCISHGLYNNVYGCYWDGTRWTLNLNDSISCGSNLTIGKICYSGSTNVNAYPESFRNGFCAPCIQNPNAPLIRYNENCTPSQNLETDPCEYGLVCRVSTSGSNKCLYEINSQQINRECIVGENECQQIDMTGFLGEALDCRGNQSQNIGSLGRCRPIHEIIQNRDQCIDDLGGDDYCRQINPNYICENNRCVVGIPTPTPPPETIFTPSTPTPPGFVPFPTRSDDYKFILKYCKNDKGIPTAIGCITGDTKELFAILLRFAIGIAGGIAFLLIIFGGLRIILSSGNPEGMMEGKEIVTSAIVGLLLIIFSVFILRFIGVDVLKIPGFSSKQIQTSSIKTTT